MPWQQLVMDIGPEDSERLEDRLFHGGARRDHAHLHDRPFELPVHGNLRNRRKDARRHLYLAEDHGRKLLADQLADAFGTEIHGVKLRAARLFFDR